VIPVTDVDTGWIYLASASPRRRELLGQLGVQCRLAPGSVDEARYPGESGEDYVRRLALSKGRAALKSLGQTAVPVLAADTAVIAGEDILGKPVDEADARRILTRLSGSTHEVCTGVVVFQGPVENVAVSRSQVRFRALSADEITAYWRTGEPRDKAGAYAIQGLGAVFVEELTGSYSGVMGLPLFETARLLESAGVHLLKR
jgi:septum formation protein